MIRHLVISIGPSEIIILCVLLFVFLYGLPRIFRAIGRAVGWIKHKAQNTPTWEGIIISTLIGLLPLYLILCFFGYMGETIKRI